MAFDVSNVFNRAWLDHTSAYRAFGLVSQGRYATPLHDNVEALIT